MANPDQKVSASARLRAGARRTVLAARRRKGLLAAIAVAAIALVVGAWLVGSRLILPSVAEDKVRSELASRLGMDVEVESVSVRPDRAALADVTLTDPDRGIVVRVGAIETDVDGVRAALQREGIRKVSVRDVAITVPPLPELRERVLASAESPPGEDVVDEEELAERGLDEIFADQHARLGVAARRLKGLLAEGAVLELENLSVTTTEGESILTQGRARLRRAPDDRLVLSGRARLDPEGHAEWSFDLDAETLHGGGRLAFARLPVAWVAAWRPELPFHEEAGVLHGDLRLRRRAELWVARGRLAVEDGAVFHPALSADPVDGLDVEVEGLAHLDPAERSLHVKEGRVRSGSAVVELQGRLTRADGEFSIDVDARLPPTDCNDLIAAIPASLLDEFDGFRCVGDFAGTLVARIDSKNPKKAQVDFGIQDDCRFTEAPEAAGLARFRQPFDHRAVGADGQTYPFPTGPGSENWVPLSEVSPFLVHAVLAHEDAAFFRHAGFAEWAIESAVRKNLERDDFAFGASTISMQLAKNLFLERKKTVERKVKEVLLTWYLEKQLSKGEILELYLNVIEYGPNLYGIGPASHHYFGRPASELSPAEAAFLASILPDPKGHHRHFDRRRLSGPMTSSLRFLLNHMAKRDRIDQAALADGLAALDDFHFDRAPRRWQPGSARALPVPTARVLPPPPGAPSWQAPVNRLDDGAAGAGATTLRRGELAPGIPPASTAGAAPLGAPGAATPPAPTPDPAANPTGADDALEWLGMKPPTTTRPAWARTQETRP